MVNAITNPKGLQTDRSHLYVFSPTPQDHTYQLQMEQLQDWEAALLGHDVVVAEIFEDRQGQIGSAKLPPEGCDGLRRQYRIPSGRFRVMLVGKDAHIKMVADTCVSVEEVVMRIENDHEHIDSTL